MKDEHASGQLPSPEDMLLRTPLYLGFALSDVSGPEILGLEYFHGHVDAYCIECKRSSIFVSQVPSFRGGQAVVEEYLLKGAFEDRWFEIELACQRSLDHTIAFFFQVKDRVLMKVGQFPSLADFQLPRLERYRGVLADEDRKELVRAIGLHAHDIGIGSFVYLRRVFERLVERARIRASESADWDEDEYEYCRMDEKILMLKDYLPDIMVENRNMYGILSKGIHELTEGECLRHFDTMRLGIEMILDAEVELERKHSASKALKDAVAKLTGELE